MAESQPARNDRRARPARALPRPGSSSESRQRTAPRLPKTRTSMPGGRPTVDHPAWQVAIAPLANSIIQAVESSTSTLAPSGPISTLALRRPGATGGTDARRFAHEPARQVEGVNAVLDDGATAGPLPIHLPMKRRRGIEELSVLLKGLQQSRFADLPGRHQLPQPGASPGRSGAQIRARFSLPAAAAASSRARASATRRRQWFLAQDVGTGRDGGAGVGEVGSHRG